MMQPMNSCSRCGAELTEGAKYCTNCGAAVRPRTIDALVVPITSPQRDFLKKIQYAEDRPMTWFKFLVYFQLIIASFGLICIGIARVGGLPLNEYERLHLAQIYLAYPALRTLDALIGLALIASAICLFFARQWMAKGRKKGIKWYLCTWFAISAARLLYALLSYAITGTFDPAEVPAFIYEIVFIVLNKVYFDKRAEMFSD